MLAKAVHYIRQADLMIIGGTSLVVYPAAGLVQYFRGRHLVVVNKGQVGSNVGADLTIDVPTAAAALLAKEKPLPTE